MINIVVEEWVAIMPAGIVRMVIDSLDDAKMRYLHLKAVQSNMDAGYRPDFKELFPGLSSSHPE